MRLAKIGHNLGTFVFSWVLTSPLAGHSLAPRTHLRLGLAAVATGQTTSPRQNRYLQWGPKVLIRTFALLEMAKYIAI